MSSLTFALLASIAALLLVGCKGQQTEQHAVPIVFAAKFFYDGERAGATHGLVSVAGTLTGPDIGYESNSTAITCYKDRMECLVYQVQQIGANQIGRLRAPNSYPITKWEPEEIVASSGMDDAKSSRNSLAAWLTRRTIFPPTTTSSRPQAVSSLSSIVAINAVANTRRGEVWLIDLGMTAQN